ncbi:MAG: radical SAM protein [Candidatus Brocadiales bacterium]
MSRGRMLIAEDFDELEMPFKRYEASRFNTSHFGLTMITSLGCNFACPYCFEAKHPSIMSDEVQQTLLQIVDDQLPNISSFFVSWFGGEPLVGKEQLLALSDGFIKRCDSAGVNYDSDIITNGYLLDEETSAQLRDRRVTRAQVTLDGPPKVHDRMRPLAGGKGSFWRIVQNLHHAIKYFNIGVRVNVDNENIGDAEELFQLLAAEGLSGKVSVYPGRVVELNKGAPAPSTTNKICSFTNHEFASAEIEFNKLANYYGFSRPSLVEPVATPCTALRENELVVGSKGELYKCWESVGNSSEVIGHIRDYKNPNGRLQKWLKFNPYVDDECRSCIVLPVCAGGCAAHLMDPLQYGNRCTTFRHTYQEQILAYIEAEEQTDSTNLVSTTQPT